MTTTAQGSSMRRDILSSYALTIARIASWVVVSALVFRYIGFDAFCTLALVRATITLLNYTTLGLTPAMIHFLGKAKPVVPVHIEAAEPAQTASGNLLRYASNETESEQHGQIRETYSNGLALAVIIALIGSCVVMIYARSFNHLFLNYSRAHLLIILFGMGVVFRLFSDAPGAVLQIRGRITLDNVMQIIAEILWVVLLIVGIWALEKIDNRFGLSRSNYLFKERFYFGMVGFAFALSAVFLVAARMAVAGQLARMFWFDGTLVRISRMWEMLAYGIWVVLAQFGNYLYAPTDYILLNKLVSAESVGIYAPAVQIDAGLLLLVSGLAAVLMPKSAMAHAAGDVQTVRRYYIRGTLASTAMLAGAAIVVWLLSPWIFKLWLNNDMKPTQAILPLVLIHTVIGGSGGVGRSILLAVGKVKPFTAAVLIAAVANVIISFCAVKFFGLGLVGVISGTICAAVGCFGIWMPWYVLRTLNRMGGKPIPEVDSWPQRDRTAD